MSATHATPEPERRPEGGPRRPPSPPLSARDRRVLARIAGYENGADPAFVARIGAAGAPRAAGSPAAPRAGPSLDRLVQYLVIAGLVALLLPGPWLLAFALLTGPAVAVFAGFRAADRGAEAARDRPSPDG